jgi:hypothetical protein
MGNTPFDFVMSHSDDDLQRLETFVHRTFNGQDFSSFIKKSQNIYLNHNGLEAVFSKHQEPASIQKASLSLKKHFLKSRIQYAQNTYQTL